MITEQKTVKGLLFGSTNHDSQSCQLQNKSTSNIVYKFSNCKKKKKTNLKNTNHQATDTRCPNRKEFLDIISRIRARSRRATILFNFSIQLNLQQLTKL